MHLRSFAVLPFVVAVAGCAPPNTAPIARVTATPPSGRAPLAVELDATRSTDDDGGPLHFSWELGDGATASHGPAIRHVFMQAGEFEVRVVVTDDAGARDEARVTIVVGEATPSELRFTTSAATSATEDVPFTTTVRAESPHGDVTLAATTLPPWLRATSSPSSLTLDGTPMNDDVGAHTVFVVAEDGVSEPITASFSIVVENVNDVPAISGAPPTSVVVGSPYDFVPEVDDVDQGDVLSFSLEGAPAWITFDADTGALGGTPTQSDVGTSGPILLAVEDVAGARAVLPPFSIAVIGDEALPPDPRDIAPPLARDLPTSTFDAARFLFEHDPPVQRAVDEGKLDPARAALLRGQVLDAAAQPLSGVRVSVHGEPGVGYTLTREDGAWDLLVNGGATPTIVFEKAGFLSVQRKLQLRAERHSVLDDVVLIRRDEPAGLIDLDNPSEPIAFVRGGTVSDERGVRAAALAVRAGTSAEVELDDGSRVPLTTMTVRVTEYTVGAQGPARMPGELPAGIGYTYAVELSVDEAEAMGGDAVHFDVPPAVYVDDFLGFPTGARVPTFTYDATLAAWLEHDDGRVIEIVDVVDGLAVIDVDGSGTPATPEALAALEIDDDERALLATRYDEGARLWRTLVTHFSPIDLNWPVVPPADAVTPDPPAPLPGFDPPERGCARAGGSTIRCEEQILVETIDVLGSDATLVSTSDRAPGFAASRELVIPLTADDVPSSLLSVRLVIDVAGQHEVRLLEPAPDLVEHFVWNGLDGFGRPVQGRVTATIRIGYDYVAQYGCGSGACPSTMMTLWQTRERDVGAYDARGVGLGGLTLSTHHVLDTRSGYMRRGDGSDLVTTGLTPILEWFIEDLYDVHNGYTDTAIAAGPDGNIYLASNTHDTVWRISRSGEATALNDSAGVEADEGPLSTMTLNAPNWVAFGPDGDLYILEEFGDSRILRVDAEGMARTLYALDAVDGDGFAYWYEWIETLDRFPADHTWLTFPNAMAVGRDGTIFLIDNGATILAISPDGWMRVVAGDTWYCDGSCGNGGPASEARLGGAASLAVDEYGGLYVADWSNGLRYIAPDGIIDLVAPGDGVADVEIAVDGEVYYVLREGHRIRRVEPGGGFVDVAGTGDWNSNVDYDGSAALSLPLYASWQLAPFPDGSLVLLQGGNTPELVLLRRAAPVADLSGALVPDPERDELHVFDARGRHQETRRLTTLASLRTFDYDDVGRLVSQTDATGRTLTITRPDAQVAVVTAEDGRETTITFDENGFAHTVLDDGGGVTTMSADAGGLLTSISWPSGLTSSASYDVTGRLVIDESTVERTQTLSRATDPASQSVVITLDDDESGETVFTTSRAGVSERLRTQSSSCCGTRSVRLVGDGALEVVDADGTWTRVDRAPDPLFGMLDPVAARTSVTRPSGAVFERLLTRSIVEGEAGALPLSRTDTLVVDGRTHTRHFDFATAVETSTSPAGRLRERTLVRDTWSRLAIGARAPLVRAFDDAGRVVVVAEGEGPDAPTWTLSYDARGRPNALTDPLGNAYALSLDDLDRPIALTMPDGRVHARTIDASGETTGLIAPDGTTWSIARDALMRPVTVVPPIVDGADDSVTYGRDAAGRVVAVLWSDGVTVTRDYDVAGRVTNVSWPTGELAVDYEDTGRVSALTTSDGQALSFAYDGALLVGVTATGVVGAQVAATFDPASRLASESVDGAHVVDYARDDDGLVVAAGPVLIERGALDDAVVGISTLALDEAREFDEAGRLIRQVVSYAATPLFAIELVRDTRGRVVSEIETSGDTSTVRTYAYDAASRLVMATSGASTTTFAYDVRDNRTTIDRDGVVTQATYDAQDRIVTQGETTYVHDTRGDRTGADALASSSTYTHDALGRLVSARRGDGPVVSYVLDPLGRRIERRRDGVHAASFVYREGLAPIAELDETGAVRSRFIYGSARDVPDAMVRDGVLYRLVRDQLGSVRLVVDADTGAVVQALAYGPFGEVLLDTSPGFQPFGFAGGLYDADTGLVRFGAREYDADTARWLSREPALFSGIIANPYVYAQSDPKNLRDPSGRAVVIIPAAVIYGMPALIAVGQELFDFGVAVGAQTGLLPLDGANNIGTGLGTAAGIAVGEIARQIVLDARERARLHRALADELDEALRLRTELEQLLEDLRRLLDC